MRTRFHQQLDEIQDAIFEMGMLVLQELEVAMQALRTFDEADVAKVDQLEDAVNTIRYNIDEKCVLVLSTQQPAARDLRVLIAALNIIIDLERMGDHAKDIAYAISYIKKASDNWSIPTEIEEMSQVAQQMLKHGLEGYRENNATIIQNVVEQDNEVDELFATLFSRVKNVPAPFETIRIAQDIERIADRVTNIAERVFYTVEGDIKEVG